jgi:hypothetical protein
MAASSAFTAGAMSGHSKTQISALMAECLALAALLPVLADDAPADLPCASRACVFIALILG